MFQEKLSIFARRFPKGDAAKAAVNARKALWWGDGAKPHILEMLRLLYLEMFGFSLTAPFFDIWKLSGIAGQGGNKVS